MLKKVDYEKPIQTLIMNSNVMKVSTSNKAFQSRAICAEIR